MRKTILSSPGTILIALLLVLGGCTRRDNSSVKSAGRDTSSVKSALLGHWVTESGKTHYYFDSAALVMLDDGRRMDSTYTVLELHEPENWIKIRVKTGYEVGHDKHLVFSPDRKSLTETMVIFSETMTTGTWNYIDSKKIP